MTQTIEVIVSPTGETRVQTKGFTGTTCRQASQFLEHALGVAGQEQLTAEYFQTQGTGNVLREGQR